MKKKVGPFSLGALEHFATSFRADFRFGPINVMALLATCLAAINTYQNQRVDWWKLVIAGMHRDFSWSASARRYGELYKGLISTRADHDPATALDPLSGSTRTPGTQHSGQRLH